MSNALSAHTGEAEYPAVDAGSGEAVSQPFTQATKAAQEQHGPTTDSTEGVPAVQAANGIEETATSKPNAVEQGQIPADSPTTQLESQIVQHNQNPPQLETAFATTTCDASTIQEVPVGASPGGAANQPTIEASSNPQTPESQVSAQEVASNSVAPNTSPIAQEVSPPAGTASTELQSSMYSWFKTCSSAYSLITSNLSSRQNN